MKSFRKVVSLLLALCVALACLTTASAYEVHGSVVVAIKAASLDLSKSIGIRFYVLADRLTSYVTSYLEVAFDADRDGVDETVTLWPEEDTVTLSDNKVYKEYWVRQTTIPARCWPIWPPTATRPRPTPATRPCLRAVRRIPLFPN